MFDSLSLNKLFHRYSKIEAAIEMKPILIPLIVPPKAYRWVREMEEIAETYADEGGFNGDIGIYGEIAKVYKTVADDTVLGEEKSDRRKRGLTIEDIAAAMGEGLKKKKRKTE